MFWIKLDHGLYWANKLILSYAKLSCAACTEIARKQVNIMVIDHEHVDVDKLNSS